MTSNDFNLLMNTECSRCNQPVKFHRITLTGTSYCLEFKFRKGYRQRLVYTIQVEHLIQSPLAPSIGKLINSELKVLAEVTV